MGKDRREEKFTSVVNKADPGSREKLIVCGGSEIERLCETKMMNVVVGCLRKCYNYDISSP